MSREQECRDLIDRYKLPVTLSKYNPGSGTKIRVHEGLGKDWFDSHAIFATTGKKGDWALVLAFLEGYAYGYTTEQTKESK